MTKKPTKPLADAPIGKESRRQRLEKLREEMQSLDNELKKAIDGDGMTMQEIVEEVRIVRQQRYERSQKG